VPEVQDRCAFPDEGPALPGRDPRKDPCRRHHLRWWWKHAAPDAPMAAFERRPVPQIRYKKGTVLCGISAGSICWFDSGHSDSLAFYHPRKWKYINVRGLGLVKGIHCPHYNSRTRGIPRRKHFRDMIRKIGGTGIAIENNCAIEFIDGRLYKVITSKKYAKAYKVHKHGGGVVARRIPEAKQLAPLESLMAL
jgi:hypothetical protein